MKVMRSMPINSILGALLTACITLGASANTFAWGHDGHAAVGILALGQLSTETRTELKRVLGSVDEQTIVEACNWPDTIRRTDEWEWTYPLHFVNIPKGEPVYAMTRDCPEQLCVTEAIKKYALQLGDPQASQQERQQAFAFVCHFTGDLHQPLHAGYSGEAYDRGGNEFNITFNGEQMNLHNLWDRALIGERAGERQELLRILALLPTVKTTETWTPALVNRWTDESHQLVETELYPANPEITQSYADKSWAILQQRINTAAVRLALIIESVL